MKTMKHYATVEEAETMLRLLGYRQWNVPGTWHNQTQLVPMGEKWTAEVREEKDGRFTIDYFVERVTT